MLPLNQFVLVLSDNAHICSWKELADEDIGVGVEGRELEVSGLGCLKG